MRKRNVELLLERARLLCDPPTWYQLAKRTGIAETTISRCRRRGGTLGDINAWKLAQLLGLDAQTVLAYMAEDRAQDQKTREFWRHQLPRLLPAIAIATAGLSLSAVGGSLIAGSEGFTVYTLCEGLAVTLTGCFLVLTSRKLSTRYAPFVTAAADSH